jgi:hypothetical protein
VDPVHQAEFGEQGVEPPGAPVVVDQGDEVLAENNGKNRAVERVGNHEIGRTQIIDPLRDRGFSEESVKIVDRVSVCAGRAALIRLVMALISAVSSRI